MVRFIDKKIHKIIDSNITKSQILDFFEKEENKIYVLVVYSKNGTYTGSITYKELLKHDDWRNCINRAAVTISEKFWKCAKDYLNEENDFLAVIDDKRELLGFAYNDRTNYIVAEGALCALENGDFFIPEKYKNIHMIVITDLNELSWRCYWLFKNMGYDVSLVGDKWEWFGLKSDKSDMEYAECSKLYIYSEGTSEKKGDINVQNYFSDIWEIAMENMKSVYVKEIEKLIDKSVQVCECHVPDVLAKDEYTPEEEKSRKMPIDICEYLLDLAEYTDENEQCIWNIFGKEKILEKKHNDENEYENIPLGEVQGMSVEGHSYNKRIYLIGPCIVMGNGCSTKDSLCGQLQILAQRFEYQVISVGIAQIRFDIWQNAISKIPIRKKDIVITINTVSWFAQNKGKVSGIPIDISLIYKKKCRENFFYRTPIHTNAEGNRMIAIEILNQYLQNKIYELKESGANPYLQKGELVNCDIRHTIASYINRINRHVEGNIGAIVMNCNPFTKGHRHLIEYAAAKMDWLYIFVVEENRSFFKYETRFQMVELGTNDLKNVIVIPSGTWVLSYKTMPIYFEKESMQNVRVNASLDIEIFARYIALPLGILKRFAGEEPLDNITRQYNEQMREILQDFDIEFEEVPRLRDKRGIYISASQVRHSIAKDKWETIKEMVPQSTYDLLRKSREIYEL